MFMSLSHHNHASLAQLVICNDDFMVLLLQVGSEASCSARTGSQTPLPINLTDVALHL